MSHTGTRKDVAAAIDADETYWNRIVETVGPENMSAPGAMGDWTFKDLAAHIAGWRTFALNRFEEKATGVATPNPYPPSLNLEDYDAINQWIHEQNRDRPLEDVLTGVTETYSRLRALVAGASDEFLFDPATGREENVSYGEGMISGEFFSHLPDEHLENIRVWLASQGKTLPDR